MKNRKQLTYTFITLAVVLVLVNFLSNNFFLRLDFTADKRYTLSNATKKILQDIKEPITVTAYFSKDVPTELQKTRRDFKELLIEYSNVSKHKVVFEFINPSDNEQIEQKAAQAGVQPVMVNVRDKDQIKQQKVFIGAVVQIGDHSEAIPVIQPGAAMEYALSSTIKKMVITDKPSVGILQGHGEPSLAGIHQAYTTLGIMYNVDLVYLTDTAYTLNKYKTIAIIAPKDTIKDRFFSQLDRFIAEGGNIFIALNHADANFQRGMGYNVNTGFENWLKNKGLTVENNFIIDENCGTAGVQQQGGFTMMIKFPYLPLITKFAKHAAVEGLEQVEFRLASSITYKDNSSWTYLPLAFTSDKSGTQASPVYFDINKQWTDNDFTQKNLVVAAALIPKTHTNSGKIIVVSNGNFAINGEGQQAQEIPADNINLMVNSIDWLGDDTGLIELRTKGITSRPLKQIDESKKLFLKYFNFLLPILIIIGYGIYRINRNRNIRIKRMEARYV
jgi:gliding-associated putative ABC transporter substrate-binding component GldG